MSTGSKGLTSTYAKSLLAAADRATLKELKQALATFASELHSNHELRETLLSPAFSEEQKLGVIEGVAPLFSGIPTFSNFLKLLVVNNRISDTQAISDKFSELALEALSSRDVIVVSATPIDDQERSRIENEIRPSLDANEVTFTWKQDERLIGGLLVQVGDKVFDSSVAGQLKKLSRHMAS